MARILVAEDDRFTLEMIERALAADGHEVVAVADGGEALAAAQVDPGFDLIITDVEMPTMSGLAVAEQIIAGNSAQRVIIMSGIADELARAGALAGQKVRILTKPVTLEKIRDETAALLT